MDFEAPNFSSVPDSAIRNPQSALLLQGLVCADRLARDI
jgi:hypothetical protein